MIRQGGVGIEDMDLRSATGASLSKQTRHMSVLGNNHVTAAPPMVRIT